MLFYIQDKIVSLRSGISPLRVIVRIPDGVYELVLQRITAHYLNFWLRDLIHIWKQSYLRCGMATFWEVWAELFEIWNGYILRIDEMVKKLFL